MAFATPHRAQARQPRRARPRRAKPRVVARPSRSRRDVEMVLCEALGWQQAELTAWVETMGTPTPPPQQRQRPPPPPPAVDALHRDCIREKFAAAVDCDKSFLEDYAVFLAARCRFATGTEAARPRARERVGTPRARAAARRVRETTKVQSRCSVGPGDRLAHAARKPAREWRVTRGRRSGPRGRRGRRLFSTQKGPASRVLPARRRRARDDRRQRFT